MVALTTGHAETRQDIASVNQAVWNTARGRFFARRSSTKAPGSRGPVLALHALAYAAGGTIQTLLYLRRFC
jgi:hypothetical protein